MVHIHCIVVVQEGCIMFEKIHHKRRGGWVYLGLLFISGVDNDVTFHISLAVARRTNEERGGRDECWIGINLS